MHAAPALQVEGAQVLRGIREGVASVPQGGDEVLSGHVSRGLEERA